MLELAFLPSSTNDGDHAEGICVFSADVTSNTVLVAYDSPKEKAPTPIKTAT